MHSSGVQLLKLMFREGETICVSPNEYGYHSMPLQKAIEGKIPLLSPNPDFPESSCDSSELTLVALNPIKGYRVDANCTAFRNFLVELDTGPLDHQYKYIKKIGLPYSAIVFSGGKSLHCLLSLEKDLPNEEAYRKVSEWLLEAVTLADKQTKNPSRSIRIPGALRTGKKEQRLIELKGPIKLSELSGWLNLHPDAQPRDEDERSMASQDTDLTKLKQWTKDRLNFGLESGKGRNIQWFSIACDFALSGYTFDDTLFILSRYFTPEKTFTKREWKTAIKSGFKHIYESRK